VINTRKLEIKAILSFINNIFEKYMYPVSNDLPSLEILVNDY
jgi:hypothetical protein